MKLKHISIIALVAMLFAFGCEDIPDPVGVESQSTSDEVRFTDNDTDTNTQNPSATFVPNDIMLVPGEKDTIRVDADDELREYLELTIVDGFDGIAGVEGVRRNDSLFAVIVTAKEELGKIVFGLNQPSEKEKVLAQLSVTVDSVATPTNQLPNPIASASVTDTTTVQFTGSGSNDPDGTIASFHWDFGDGNESDKQNPLHTYLVAGTYTVTLTVTDDDDSSASASLDVTVKGRVIPVNKAPNPIASASVTDTTTVQFTGSGSNDPDGTIASFHWDFGDGNESDKQNPLHTYLVAGTYTVTLTVTDDDDSSASASLDVTVKEGGSDDVVKPPSFYHLFSPAIWVGNLRLDDTGTSINEEGWYDNVVLTVELSGNGQKKENASLQWTDADGNDRQVGLYDDARGHEHTLRISIGRQHLTKNQVWRLVGQVTDSFKVLSVEGENK